MAAIARILQDHLQEVKNSQRIAGRVENSKDLAWTFRLA